MLCQVHLIYFAHKHACIQIPFVNSSPEHPNLTLDKTCKLWSAETGQLYHTYRGHATEIVCLSFNPHGTMLATGSMDNTSRLWDVETGECLHTLLGNTAAILMLWKRPCLCLSALIHTLASMVTGIHTCVLDRSHCRDRVSGLRHPGQPHHHRQL
jgi:WD40 repeat protein